MTEPADDEQIVLREFERTQNRRQFGEGADLFGLHDSDTVPPVVVTMPSRRGGLALRRQDRRGQRLQERQGQPGLRLRGGGCVG